MDYLEHNKQEAAQSAAHKFLVKTLSKSALKVTGTESHMSFFLYYFLQKYAPFKEGKNIIVVDIGGAKGDYISYSAPNIEKYVVDIDDFYSLELKKQKISFKKCDLEKDRFPFKDKSVDIVILNHILEHLQNPFVALQKIHQALKEGGIAIIRVPDISRVGWSFYDDFTHVTPFNKGKMRNMLSTAKFSIQYLDNFNYSHFMGSFFLTSNPALSWSRFGNEVIAIAKK